MQEVQLKAGVTIGQVTSVPTHTDRRSRTHLNTLGQKGLCTVGEGQERGLVGKVIRCFHPWRGGSAGLLSSIPLARLPCGACGATDFPIFPRISRLIVPGADTKLTSCPQLPLGISHPMKSKMGKNGKFPILMGKKRGEKRISKMGEKWEIPHFFTRQVKAGV